MAKARTSYECSRCGHRALAWGGQCPGCGEWNTLEQVTEAPRARAGGRSAKRRGSRPVALRDVSVPDERRLLTGIGELDRVLGGGLVPGSLVLLGGEPGIGKSTITAMALGNLTQRGAAVLYITGEESAAQVRMRAERLGDSALSVPTLAEADLVAVVAALEAERPAVCVIDSIQTMRCEGVESAPGSVGQVREAAAALQEVAKRIDCALVLVGHVTKEGSVAGPRVLEHLVDAVLFFEGERERTYRTLRALKNRFGATDEVGVFEMREGGLVEVADPSERFVGEASGAAGSCVLCAIEGTRPVLVEVQALVSPVAAEGTPPRRVANGIDRNRLAMVIAVLARHGGPQLGSTDAFVNVVGGVRVGEPAADLAVAIALASAHSGVAPGLEGQPPACFGEIGLTGEMRPVGHPDRRLAEARKFGLERVLGPASPGRLDGLEGVASVREALAACGSGGRPAVRAA